MIIFNGREINIKNIEETIRRIFSDNVSSSVSFQDFEADHLLEEAGVNSIEFIKVIVALETEFGVEFPDDLDYSELTTLNEIVSYLSEMINKKQ